MNFNEAERSAITSVLGEDGMRIVTDTGCLAGRSENDLGKLRPHELITAFKGCMVAVGFAMSDARKMFLHMEAIAQELASRTDEGRQPVQKGHPLKVSATTPMPKGRTSRQVRDLVTGKLYSNTRDCAGFEGVCADSIRARIRKHQGFEYVTAPVEAAA